MKHNPIILLSSSLFVVAIAGRASADDCTPGFDRINCYCPGYEVAEVAFGQIVRIDDDFRLQVMEVFDSSSNETLYEVGDELKLVSVPSHGTNAQFVVFGPSSIAPGGYTQIIPVQPDGTIASLLGSSDPRCTLAIDAREWAAILTGPDRADCPSAMRQRLDLPAPDDCQSDSGCAGGPGFSLVTAVLALAHVIATRRRVPS